eukprot:4117565-Amphidinium_carterae.1
MKNPTSSRFHASQKHGLKEASKWSEGCDWCHILKHWWASGAINCLRAGSAVPSTVEDRVALLLLEDAVVVCSSKLWPKPII